MDRKILILIGIGSVVIFAILLLNQQLFEFAALFPEKPKVVGGPKVIGIVQLMPLMDRLVIGLKEGMEELGYVENKDVIYEYQTWNEDPQKIDPIVQSFIDKDVDLIYALAAPSALSAKKFTETKGKLIPIVFASTETPDKIGLVENLKSSGNHLTGITANFGEVMPKQLEFLKRMAPGAKRIGVFTEGFYVPNSVGQVVLDALRKEAPKFNLTLVEYTTDAPPGPENERAFYQVADNIKPGDIDAIVHIAAHFIPDQYFLEIAIARRHKIPSIMPILEEMELGGLYSYASDYIGVGKQAAVMVDKIFKGTKPTDIPIESPKKNILGINLGTARSIGINIPEDILAIAEMKIDWVMQYPGR